MPRLRLLRILGLAFLVSASALASAVSPPCAPPSPDPDWEVAAPAQAGFDAAALCAALESAASEKENLHGVVVERGGRLVAELYRTGPDSPIDVHYGLGSPFAGDVAFDADQLHDVRSVSKSVVGLLIGNVVRDGKIESLSAPVLDSFPELSDLRSDGRGAITIENLLTMSSGLRWSEWGRGTLTSDETRLFWKSDQIRFLFDRPLAYPPGTHFNYNGGGTAALADLLVRATGRPLRDLAREQLFEPLGITRWEWAADLRDRPLAFAGLRLRPRDLAKLGRLALAHGRWRERQVVPEAWIAESLRPHIRTGISGMSDPPVALSYGYQWWTGSVRWRGRELPWSAAVGNGGQRLYVVPELDLCVVTTAGGYGELEINHAVYRIFEAVVTAAGPR